MSGRLDVDPNRVRTLASGFKDASNTLGGMSGHDSADQITAGLADTSVGGACSAAAAAAGAALTAVSGHYDTLHTHGHNSANDYDRTEDVSVDKFTTLGDSI
ncbi:type VII secretion target [Nocardia sp. NPDC006630]|uniref:type VII secretion target n=1 Tax=Nocardia sp. NPDC006630 TaxID=3157181 RepID=UPI0033BB7A55